MNAVQTEFEFSLPVGYVDETGTLHKEGVMRMATAADEILPMKDPRVQGNPHYMSVILFSRVITSLGSLPAINTRIVENLFSRDFTYLQDLYNRVNKNGTNLVTVSCPKCDHSFDVEVDGPGEV